MRDKTENVACFLARKFKWDAWDFDCDGSAYIIAKDECPNTADVPDYICRVDGIHSECKPEMVVQEGWCAYQWRCDWYDCDERRGSYIVMNGASPPVDMYGKKKPGWFPVWIVRKDEWY